MFFHKNCAQVVCVCGWGRSFYFNFMREKNSLENDTFFEHISQFNRGPDIFCKIFVFICSHLCKYVLVQCSILYTAKT
jgi:hypothetical protein